MRKLRSCFISFVFFAVFVTLFCSAGSKEKDAEKVRGKKERAITIVNKTGDPIKGYQVYVASSGVEIVKGITSNDSFSIIINDSYKKDSEIEVVLIDIYDRIYAKTFTVPLKGNTDTPITAEDRKSEGVLKDKWKDFVAWINKNK